MRLIDFVAFLFATVMAVWAGLEIVWFFEPDSIRSITVPIIDMGHSGIAWLNEKVA